MKKMLQEFIMQNYLIVTGNVVTNNVVWDGDTTKWAPPQGSIALIDATTIAKIWQPIRVDKKITGWELVEEVGAGDIGFTWDGSILITNEPEPPVPVPPTTTGTIEA